MNTKERATSLRSIDSIAEVEVLCIVGKHESSNFFDSETPSTPPPPPPLGSGDWEKDVHLVARASSLNDNFSNFVPNCHVETLKTHPPTNVEMKFLRSSLGMDGAPKSP